MEPAGATDLTQGGGAFRGGSTVGRHWWFVGGEPYELRGQIEVYDGLAWTTERFAGVGEINW